MSSAPPIDTAAAQAKVAGCVPATVRGVCARLSSAGFEAVTVGGGVRDALLGRSPVDWDVATSARPEDVVELFEHTIPTGLRHGTVSVVVGRGEWRQIIEVTTYRGEGAYTDSRRPDEVTFGVPLREDLARRDFVINAIAFDPVHGRLIDPFGGQEDLANRVIRAVGDARERFSEDGLRVMRAVRFAATLGFALEPETAAGISPALGSLKKVAWERIWVELEKTLRAPRPGPSLELSWTSGILSYVLPECIRGEDSQVRERFAVVDGTSTLHARMAALLDGADAATVKAALKRLKTTNSDQAALSHIVESDRTLGHAHALSGAALRRAVRDIGRPHSEPLWELWSARASIRDDREMLAFVASCRAIVDSDLPLRVGELPITGSDVLECVGRPPGRWVGDVLETLLVEVLDDPSRNDRAVLLARAVELAAGSV